MISRVLEPEPMETADDVRQYDAMDHSAVNARFVEDFLTAHGPCRGGEILDVGTGTARIPIALCLADSAARILALDLSEPMLERAAANIAAAGLSPRIRCHHGDAKSLITLFGEGSFEGVVSNTIVHHIPDPEPALDSMARLVARGGTLMIRDLARPGIAPGDPPAGGHLCRLGKSRGTGPLRSLARRLLDPRRDRRDRDPPGAAGHRSGHDLRPALDLDVASEIVASRESFVLRVEDGGRPGTGVERTDGHVGNVRGRHRGSRGARDAPAGPILAPAAAPRGPDRLAWLR